MDKFIQGIDKAEALIGREGHKKIRWVLWANMRCGLCSCTGRNYNLVNRILTPLDIEDDYQEDYPCLKILGYEYFIRNRRRVRPCYRRRKNCFPGRERRDKDAQNSYTTSPIEAQTKLMEDHGHTSFDVREYQEQYKKRMKKRS